MKKLKYLFWLLIVWAWVILTSFSYAQNSDWYFHWNVISSKNWSNLTFSSEALAEWIWKPLFAWWGNLINLAIKFIPVFLVIAFFWLFLSFMKNLWKIKKEKKDKDLDNK